jgi:hypothetical protein
MREQDRRQRATGRGQWRWRSREDDNGAWSRGQVVSVCRALPLPHLSCACAAAQVEFHQGDDGARVYSLVYRHRELDKKMEAGQGHSIPWLRCYCLLPPRRVAPPPSLLTSHSFLLPLFPAPWRQVGCPLACGVASACSLRLRALLLLKRDHTLVASNACCMPRPCSHACAVA